MENERIINKKFANWINESRNNWKKRALEKQQKLREAQIKIRDLERSREKWKKKAKENQKRALETEQIHIVQQKKGKC
jgi:hypothetical protein